MVMIVYWLIYGTISLLLMIFFIVLFGKYKQFNFSFYRLVQCDLVLNALVYISTWIARLLNQPTTQPFFIYVYHKYHFVFVVSASTTFYFYHAQSVSTILLCTHRYTMARFSMANQFWKYHYFKVYIGGMGYCCAAFALFCFTGIVAPSVYYEEVKAFGPDMTDEHGIEIFFYSMFGFSALYFFLIFFIGIMSLWEVKKRFSGVFNSTQTKAMTKQMTIIVIVNTCIYLTVIIWQLLGPSFIWEFPPDKQDAILMTVSDILSLSMPYTLLIFDKNVKSILLRKTQAPGQSRNSITAVVSKQPHSSHHTVTHS